jgi:hypothetical protein
MSASKVSALLKIMASCEACAGLDVPTDKRLTDEGRVAFSACFVADVRGPLP